MEEHRALQQQAVDAEAQAQRALMAGEDARDAFARAASLYRRSWDAAPPGAFGRLIGALKAAVIAGDAERTRELAAYVEREIPDPPSPPAHYALAIAALVAGRDFEARGHAEAMRAGGEPFRRAAEAIDALAAGDAGRYAAAVSAIVGDFEGRDEHLTGVAIADTAVMLERLAAARGIAAGPESPLM